MKTFNVKFNDVWEINDEDNEQNLYDFFLVYLQECVENKDLTSFEFEEIL